MHSNRQTSFLADLSDHIGAALNGTTDADASVRAIDTERAYISVPAPNAIQWAVGREYLDSPSLIANYSEQGEELPGYWRSYQVIRDVFQLRCPICNPRRASDCWGKTRMQLESEVLLEWSPSDDDDACPKCRMTRRELQLDRMLKPINQMHLVCGMRSGKSVTAGMIGTYVEHRLATIAHSHPGGLRGYLGLTLDDPMEMTFLASNEVQGVDTIWAKYRAFRRDSPWFQRYVPWLKSQEAKQRIHDGMEAWTYTETNKRIVNEHPDLFLIVNSLNSNSSGLRGRTRVFGGIDEIAYMLDGDSRMSADEVYRAIDNSLQTVRSRSKLNNRLPWLGLMCSVSSPRARDDKAMRLLRDAPNIEGMVAWHYATWDFNPFEPRDGFEANYSKDPVGAERDFGANPPAAEHPLITDVRRFRDLAVGDDSIVANAWFDYVELEDQDQRYIGVKLRDAQLSFDNPRYIAFDAGRNFDAFAGACAHPEIVEDPDTGASRIITVYDWIIRILSKPGTEVYFDSVYELVRKLKDKQPVIRCEFDHWNATYLVQQIRQLGIHAEEVNIKDSDYHKFRQDAYQGSVKMIPPTTQDLDARTGEWKTDPPMMSPESCAVYELESLQEDPDTRKITNPRKGRRLGWNSNDVAAVVVHAHKMVQDAGYVKKDNDRSRAAARKRSEADAAMYIQRGQGRVANVSRAVGGKGTRNWQSSGRGW